MVEKRWSRGLPITHGKYLEKEVILSQDEEKEAIVPSQIRIIKSLIDEFRLLRKHIKYIVKKEMPDYIVYTFYAARIDNVIVGLFLRGKRDFVMPLDGEMVWKNKYAKIAFGERK